MSAVPGPRIGNVHGGLCGEVAMKPRRLYCLVTAVLLGAVAVAHLLRVVYGLEVRVGEASFPMALSVLGVAAAGGLSLWGFLLAFAEGEGPSN